jgi:hypothetical protein
MQHPELLKLHLAALRPGTASGIGIVHSRTIGSVTGSAYGAKTASARAASNWLVNAGAVRWRPRRPNSMSFDRNLARSQPFVGWPSLVARLGCC